MRKSLIVLFGLCSILSAEQISYSQNNLPNQNQLKGNVDDQTPVLINADLIYGEIIGTPLVVVRQNIFTNNTTEANFKVPTNAGFGFRIGLGVALKQLFNLSVQWTWLQNSAREKLSFAAEPTQVIGVTTVGINQIFQDAVEVDLRQKYRTNTVDLLMQTIHWVATSFIKVQPFGGLRYFYFKRSLFAKVTNVTIATLLNDAKAEVKLHATGVLLGSDIKYLINDYFHFFSTITAGILAGQWKQLNQNSEPLERKYSQESTFSPLIEFNFGLAFQKLFGNHWLLSIRVAYELTSLFHNSATPLGFGFPTPSFGTPTEQSIVIQKGLAGITLGF